MAKKTEKKAIVESELKSEGPIVEAKLMTEKEAVQEIKEKNKKTIDSMTLPELVYAEKASRLVCQKYENTVKNYDGSFQQNTIEYEKFKKINTIHQNILNKIENKLLEL